jgi:hypothetical protein
MNYSKKAVLKTTAENGSEERPIILLILELRQMDVNV